MLGSEWVRVSATTGQRTFLHCWVVRGLCPEADCSGGASSGDGAGSFYILCVIEVLSMSFPCQWGWSLSSKWCLYTNRSALLLHYNPIWNFSLEGFFCATSNTPGKTALQDIFHLHVSVVTQLPPSGSTREHGNFFGRWETEPILGIVNHGSVTVEDGGTQKRREQVFACCRRRIASTEPLKDFALIFFYYHAITNFVYNWRTNERVSL